MTQLGIKLIQLIRLLALLHTESNIVLYNIRVCDWGERKLVSLLYTCDLWHFRRNSVLMLQHLQAFMDSIGLWYTNLK